MHSFVSAMCAAAFSIQFAQAASAKQLNPVDKWVVDFGHSRCVAVRAFGTTESPVHLVLKPSPIGDVLQLQVIETGTNRPGTQQRIALTFGDGAPEEMLQLQYGAGGKQVRLVNLPKDQIDRLSSSTALRWSSRGKEYQLALGPMVKLLKTLEQCKGVLADHWNATLTKQITLQKPPSPEQPIISLFSTGDYPSEAITNRQSGLAHVVLLVDEKGVIADCTLIATSGIAVLDAQSCIIIKKRAKFAPAIGKDGRPTRSIFHQRVNWVP